MHVWVRSTVAAETCSHLLAQLVWCGGDFHPRVDAASATCAAMLPPIPSRPRRCDCPTVRDALGHIVLSSKPPRAQKRYRGDEDPYISAARDRYTATRAPYRRRERRVSDSPEGVCASRRVTSQSRTSAPALRSSGSVLPCLEQKITHSTSDRSCGDGTVARRTHLASQNARRPDWALAGRPQLSSFADVTSLPPVRINTSVARATSS